VTNPHDGLATPLIMKDTGAVCRRVGIEVALAFDGFNRET